MPYIEYTPKAFRAEALIMIKRADTLCQDYANQGYVLTLRQLYYQFVSRGWLPNKQSEYKRLGDVVNDARLAGKIDWNHLEDRTRNLRSLSHWSSPAGVIDAAAASYHRDLWADQRVHVEAWVEKDALVGVLERACTTWDVPYFSCRGYVSQSEMWAAAQRFRRLERAGKQCVVLHLGDHDPSGLQMTEDMQRRLQVFGSTAKLDRLALSMAQIEQYAPPPNPAKATDARYQWYVENYDTEESWELDALEPAVLSDLITTAVERYVDTDRFQRAKDQQEQERVELKAAASDWSRVLDLMRDDGLVSDQEGEG